MKTLARFPLIAVAALVAVSDAGATNAVVTNCSEAGLVTALSTVDGSGGGTITFNCGTATIAFTSYKTIANAVVIDGGGTITFDGGNTSAFFQVFGSATVVLKRLTFQHGEFSSAHALENFGFLRLDQVTMKNNASIGAPILNLGDLIVEGSTFSGNANTGTATNGRGGVILNDGGDMTIRTSTFADNAAATGGGAIYSTTHFDVSNSTFTGNSTTGSGSGGGAIHLNGTGASAITYSTIVGNTGQTFGGGIYNEGGGGADATLTVSRSIIANNQNGNCDGVPTSGGYNLWFGATSCPFSGTGDGAGDPMLGALAANGGPTQTMMPGSGSAAVNRIPHAQCAYPYDQRSAVRPEGPVLPGSGMCDSGAVERSSSIVVIFYDSFN